MPAGDVGKFCGHGDTRRLHEIDRNKPGDVGNRKIIAGRKIHPDIRAIIIPGTQEIYMEALKRGYIAQFIEAGAVVSTPTCGPCLGGYMGILAAGERAVATTNRNFVGRMGHPESGERPMPWMNSVCIEIEQG